MRFTSSLSIPLMLASSVWLAGCSPAATPPADAAAPPPMQGPAPMEGPAPMHAPEAPTPPNDTEAPTPLTRDAPFEPAAATPPATPDGAAAQGDARARIDRVLGNAPAYEKVFTALQTGVAASDRAAVAALMRYPLRVDIGGTSRQIRDAATFEREYDRIITAAVARTIAAQDFDTVFANQQGVMLGNGQVWINGTCEDAACTRSDVRVVSIQD